MWSPAAAEIVKEGVQWLRTAVEEVRQEIVDVEGKIKKLKKKSGRKGKASSSGSSSSRG